MGNNNPTLYFSRPYDVNTYINILRKTVGYNPYKWSSLPNDLKIKRIHYKLINRGIIKRVEQSSRGNTWILMI